MNIFVRDLTLKTEKQITSVTDRDISGYFWKGNKYLIYSKDFKGDENYHLYLTDINGKKAKEIESNKLKNSPLEIFGFFLASLGSFSIDFSLNEYSISSLS